MTTTFEDSFSEEIWRLTYKFHQDETVDDTMRRVAKAAASVEKNQELREEWSKKFYSMLSDFKVTAGGRIYSNAGTDWKGTTLMNCFVGPLPEKDIDSLDGILKILRDQSQTLKSEGGWGFNFSFIRPRGAFIHGIGVETPGAVKYMELFDKSSEIVTSGSGLESSNKNAKGKIRKGAMMGVIDVWHPDVIEFISAKQTAGRLSKFNISVNCTDEFMNKVLKVQELKKQKADQEEIDQADEWLLRFPETTHKDYKTSWTGDIKKWEQNEFPVKVYRKVSATWLWNLIMESTYNRAEPGVLFLDRANHLNPLNYRDTIYATNPCGEQTLAPGGVCNLGSVNLTQFVKSDGSGFDYAKIKKYVRYLVRFLDNINDLSEAPLPDYEDSMKNKRRIGVGVLGWGSALYMLKIKFGSEQASEIRDKLMRTISHTAAEASVDLAEEKGKFKYCKPKKHAESAYFKQIELPERILNKMRQVGIRNSSLMSIQPTGNTSIFANVVSGGIEPVFLQEYIRTVIVPTVPKHIRDVTPKYWEGEFEETSMFKFDKEGDEVILKGKDAQGVIYKIDKNRGLTKEVLCEDYGVRYLKSKNEWDPKADWATTTASMTVQDHVEDLKGFSKYVDSAISKTVNVPNNYSFNNFQNIYVEAFKTNYIKGITTYRAGTMTTVLSAKDEKTANDVDEEIIKQEVKLPDSNPAFMKVLKAEGRKWYLTVVMNQEQNRPFAIFVHTNHTEKNVTTHDAIERMFALARRKKIPKRHIDAIKEKAAKDSNSSKIARSISLLLRHGVLIKNIVAELDKVEDAHVGSFLFHIKKFLGSYIKDGERVEDACCTACGSNKIVYSEGCMKCQDCGSSKCG